MQDKITETGAPALHQTLQHFELQVNGETRDVRAYKDSALLLVLRNELSLNGPKYGCGLGECGACTVLIGGIAARSCIIPAWGVRHREITTLEGLGNRENLHPVQQAFIDKQAAQCGYCLNGMIMTCAGLLNHNPQPDEQQIRQALSGNLCRCGTHLEILQAARHAVILCQRLTEENDDE